MRLRDIQQRLPTRHGSPAFDEADLSLRNACVEREIELTGAPNFSPVAEPSTQLLRRSLVEVQCAHGLPVRIGTNGPLRSMGDRARPDTGFFNS
jgi:hypothetical protein